MMFFRTIALLMLLLLTTTQKSFAHSPNVAQPEGLIAQLLSKSAIVDQTKIATDKKILIADALAEQIKKAARTSEVSQRQWIAVIGDDPTKKPSAHGRAPMGYTIGMALAYAEAYSKRTTDAYVVQMSRPVVKPTFRRLTKVTIEGSKKQ
jgi:superfamily I DNA and RNA helicase